MIKYVMCYTSQRLPLNKLYTVWSCWERSGCH